MIKFDTNPAALTYPKPSHKDLESAHRLIVLVPANMDFSAGTQRIWRLANTAGMQVQLLSLCKDASEESRRRRDLITMASLLQNGGICAEVKVSIGTNWLDVVKANCESGDMIVCFAEQSDGLLRRPLSQMLASNFNATVYILPNLTSQRSRSNRLSQMSAWLGLIGVIVGFGVLQAQIVQLQAGWLQNIMLILSLIPEFWLIWVWDGQFR
jgi:hypothetical protein